MYKTRDEIPTQFKWSFEDLIKNESEFNEIKTYVESNYTKLSDFKGRLNESTEVLENFIQLMEDVRKSVHVLIVYSAFRYHINLKDQKMGAALQEVDILSNKVMTELSWVNAELVSIGKEQLFSLVEASDKLKEYTYFFDKLFVLQDHILDEQTEKTLSYFNLFNDSPSDLYSKLANSDAKVVKATLKNGDEVEVTPGNFTTLLQELEDQQDRLTVLKARYKVFDEHKNTFAGIYNQVVQRDVAMARAQKFDDSLNSYLKRNNIPTDIYFNLVNTVKENADVFKKYIELRKKYFKLDHYYTFDRFLDFAKSTKKYTYEEGLALSLEAAKSVNEEYYDYFKTVTQDGWIDVYETPGKITGAYSWGYYGAHPYILLNYNDSLDDVFTLSHEAGHSIHSYLSYKNQPYATHDYTIFVAEVASTFAEHVLHDYLNKTLTDKDEKLMLLQKAMDDIMATFLRQTVFADYELQIHQLAENGQAITADVLSNKMKELYMEYYGIDLAKEEVKELVWAYIPHLFNTPFYVYQYATCFATSSKLYEDYKEDGQTAINNFFTLLKSGGNDYPYQQVLNAGVDLTQKDVILAVINRAKEIVEELDTLLFEQ